MKKWICAILGLILCVSLISMDSYSTTKTNEGESLDIQINTKHLSKIASEKNKEWKLKIIQLAKENPKQVYLKGTAKNVKKVALTFDDGPDASVTLGVIKALEAEKVKGTFFFTGSAMEKYPQVVKRAYELGHQVAGHSYSHPKFSKIDSKQITTEISKTNKAFKTIIGVVPLYFRPPYGDIDQAILKDISMDTQVVIWSLDTMDWSKGTSSKEITDYILSHVKPNDIVLMHSNKGKKQTLEAVPQIIKGLKKKGFELVTVSEMLEGQMYKP